MNTAIQKETVIQRAGTVGLDQSDVKDLIIAYLTHDTGMLYEHMTWMCDQVGLDYSELVRDHT